MVDAYWAAFPSFTRLLARIHRAQGEYCLDVLNDVLLGRRARFLRGVHRRESCAPQAEGVPHSCSPIFLKESRIAASTGRNSNGSCEWVKWVTRMVKPATRQLGAAGVRL